MKIREMVSWTTSPNPLASSFSKHSEWAPNNLFPWDKALSTADSIEDVERIEADRSRWSRL